MYCFRNDYSEGALPQVLEALTRTNLEATVGYGMDPYCERAAAALKARFACPDADVHFLVGGTQTNFCAITAFLRPWEAVIAADSGHIAVHETGAVEARGHKVVVVPSPDGKLRPDQIVTVLRQHEDGKNEHMVLPRLVYISQATELGTVYSKDELAALSVACRRLGLYLYLDGARLPAALVCGADVPEPEALAQYCDAFYLGGTKNGLLFGEALFIVRSELKANFRHAVKQNGAMLAKGRLLGVQFLASLEDELWLQAARHAFRLARRLDDGLRAKGVPMLVDSPTNQIFPVFPKAQAAELEKAFSFELWGETDEAHMVIRLVTSWATEDAAVDAFLAAVSPCG